MSQAIITPGEWWQYQNLRSIKILAEPDIVVARLFVDDMPGKRLADVAANAALLAAAPYLLAACQAWDEGFVEGEEFTEKRLLRWMNANRQAARGAVALALGGQS